MKIEVHESALDSIKAMGQRDKERIVELSEALIAARNLMHRHSETMKNAIAVIDQLMVNPYSKAIIQKAE